jgi:hypothetical protein
MSEPIKPRTWVRVRSGDKDFYGTVKEAEYDTDQWSYLVKGEWFCQSEVEPMGKVYITSTADRENDWAYKMWIHPEEFHNFFIPT